MRQASVYQTDIAIHLISSVRRDYTPDILYSDKHAYAHEE